MSVAHNLKCDAEVAVGQGRLRLRAYNPRFSIPSVILAWPKTTPNSRRSCFSQSHGKHCFEARLRPPVDIIRG